MNYFYIDNYILFVFMKKSIYILIILLFLIIPKDMKAQVGIGTATPNASSMLDITSTNKGLLIPRVALISTSDVATIASPVTSLLVYNSGFLPNGYYYWNGTLWVLLATGNNTGWSLTGNSGTNPANNFIGTTDPQDLRFRRNNQWAGTIASSVTSFGAQAGRTNTATNNTFIGANAGELVSAGASSGNVGIGTLALQGNANTISQNVAIGYQAMQTPAAAANNNVVIGYQAGSTLSTSNNVIIGQGAGGGVTNNCIIIGQGAASGGASSIRIGTTQTVAQVPIAWSLISDRRAKSDIKDSPLGLDFIKTLRPVSYYKNNDENKKTEYGFIAQEVEEALINFGDKNNGVVHIDPNGDYSLRYNDIIPLTVKAVQEQQELIEQLKKANAELVKANATILKRLEKLEKK
jgi:hypothetical protein